MKGAEKIRKLPAVERVLEVFPDHPDPGSPGGRAALVQAVREVLGGLRARIRAGGDVTEAELEPAAVASAAARRAAEVARGTLRPVVNATGVVVHTNLGRAPLSPEVAAQVVEALTSYTNLEYDLGGRARGSRYDHVTGLLLRLAPAEAGLVVNNNAAAVLLALAELAAGREVVVSRGELIEVGGGFRIPDVMAASGARLVEVGTTNRTRIADYEAAIGPDTAVLFKAHRSNFRMEGFVEDASFPEVAALARSRGVFSVADLGSGVLDASRLPFACGEPTVAQVLGAGFDLACFSGDKLLGGPQAGVIVGRAAAVARLRKNPLLRALRVGSFTIAAMEATLGRHLACRDAEIPVLAALLATPAEVKARCERVSRTLRRLGTPNGTAVETVPTTAEVGGGTLPGREVPSFGLAVSRPGWSEVEVEAALRGSDPPVLGRLVGGRLVLDLRTLLAGQEETVAAALHAMDSMTSPPGQAALGRDDGGRDRE
jgi:L-seryl-tRNA(Ser) seleniumtransferase